MALIGLTTGMDESKPRMTLNMDYADAVTAAGGVALALPCMEGEQAAENAVAAMDALVFTGGVDLDSALYGQAPHKTADAPCVLRDRYELRAICAALRMDKPILCICRGLQLLNVALGGTLHQDIDACVDGCLNHPQYARVDEPVHRVRVAADSLLSRVAGSDDMYVNSRHHQCAHVLGRGLVPAAWADDQVVEAAYMPGKRFVLAVQWHPESLYKRDARQLMLFEALVAQASGER